MSAKYSQAPPSDLVQRTKVYSQRSTARTIYWIVTLLAATIYLAASIPKLGGFGFFDTSFEAWGYPHWLELSVGVVEASAAIFLIIPATALYSAVILGVVMLGAIFTHLVFGSVAVAIVPAIMLGVLFYIGWTNRPSEVKKTARRHEVFP